MEEWLCLLKNCLLFEEVRVHRNKKERVLASEFVSFCLRLSFFVGTSPACTTSAALCLNNSDDVCSFSHDQFSQLLEVSFVVLDEM